MTMPTRSDLPGRAIGERPGGEHGGPARRDRRRRILDAALALAASGGYDAVQMRAVAERAEVALGTLYRYFPSKVHLLVSALARELERTEDRIDRSIPRGRTPYDRLMLIISGVTKSLQRDPQVTEAMTRAFVSADASAAAEVDAVSRLMDGMFARALTNDEPTDDQLAIARVISDVWVSNLMAWVNRRASAADLAQRLDLTVALLLGQRRPAAGF